MDKINISTLPCDVDKDKLISSCIHGNEINIEFSYLSCFHNTKVLRDFISIIGQKVGLNPIAISRMTLIADEMNNNAIEHGSLEGETNKFRVWSEVGDVGVSICIEAEDTGNGPGANKALDMETLRAHQLKRGYRDHHSIRGRGLFMIIVNIVDRVYFRDSKNGGLIVGVKKIFSVIP